MEFERWPLSVLTKFVEENVGVHRIHSGFFDCGRYARNSNNNQQHE